MGISAAAVASWVAIALAAGLVGLATQNFRRTKGRIWKFHAIYALVVAVLVLVLPLSVKQVVFSSAGVAVAGMIFPVYQSLRALCTPATADDMEWLQYWCAQGGLYVSIIGSVKFIDSKRYLRIRLISPCVCPFISINIAVSDSLLEGLSSHQRQSRTGMVPI